MQNERSSIGAFPLWRKVLYFARVMAKLPLLSKWQKCQKCIVHSLISSLNTGSLSLTLSKCFPARIYLKGCACLVFKMLASQRETLYSRIYFASKKDLDIHSPRFVEWILHLESGNRERRCLEGDEERMRNEWGGLRGWDGFWTMNCPFKTHWAIDTARLLGEVFHTEAKLSKDPEGMNLTTALVPVT